MSNHTIERQLDLVINLLESLPDRMINAINADSNAKKALRVKELQNEMEFLHNNQKEINKMMFGVDYPAGNLKQKKE